MFDALGEAFTIEINGVSQPDLLSSTGVTVAAGDEIIIEKRPGQPEDFFRVLRLRFIVDTDTETMVSITYTDVDSTEETVEKPVSR